MKRSRALAPVAALLAAVLGVPAAAATTGAPSPAVRSAALDPGLPTSGPALVPVVVTGPGGPAGLRAAVHGAGGTVDGLLPLVDGVAARVPAGRLADLAASPAVRAVTADRVGRMTTLPDPFAAAKAKAKGADDKQADKLADKVAQVAAAVSASARIGGSPYVLSS